MRHFYSVSYHFPSQWPLTFLAAFLHSKEFIANMENIIPLHTNIGLLFQAMISSWELLETNPHKDFNEDCDLSASFLQRGQGLIVK